MTSIWTGWSGAQIPVGARDFSLRQNIQTCCGSPLIHLLSVFWYSFWGVKLLGHEINDSPASSTKVKHDWSNIYTPPLLLHGKGRENFIFPLLSSVVVCKCLISVCQALEVCTKVWLPQYWSKVATRLFASLWWKHVKICTEGVTPRNLFLHLWQECLVHLLAPVRCLETHPLMLWKQGCRYDYWCNLQYSATFVKTRMQVWLLV